MMDAENVLIVPKDAVQKVLIRCRKCHPSVDVLVAGRVS